LLAGGLTTFLSGLVAGFCAIWFTRPISEIAETLREFRWESPQDNLPTHLRDEIGDVARAFSALMDRLSMSELRALAIVESITDALVVIDQQGIILEFSDTAEKMFGYDRSDAVGSNVSMLMPEPYRTQLDSQLTRLRASGRSEIMDKTRVLKGRRRNGEVFPIELTVSVLQAAGSNSYVGAIRDITDQKRAAVTRSDFFSALYYNLGALIGSIQTALMSLKDNSAPPSDDRSAHLVDRALAEVKRLSQLIDEVLDLRRIEAGLLQYQMENIDIRAIMDEIVDRYEPLAAEHGVRLALDNATAPVEVRIDPGRLEQALAKILSNAVRFSPVGETVTVKVGQFDENWVRIDIADRGPGIPDSLREKIYAPFSISGADGNRSKGSTGLGLTLAKSLVEVLSGRISFNTEIGAGTTFHVDFLVSDVLPGEGRNA
jgi:PAS domain S-box-containing protein